MFKTRILGSSLALLMVGLNVQATPISIVQSSSSAAHCTTSGNVTLNAISTTQDPNTQLNAFSHHSTTCGLYSGNTTPRPDSSLNVGLLDDGFMNMLLQRQGGYAYLDFIRPQDLQVLNPQGLQQDPGWIMLASGDTGTGGSTPVSIAQVKNQSLDSILDVTFSGNSGLTSGEWSLDVKPAAIQFAEAILGRPAVFDHLAIVLKAGNSFAVYDFNFSDIFGTLPFGTGGVEPNPALNFFTPLSFNGTWSTNDFLNPAGNNAQALSNWMIFARDPILPSQEVSAPGMLIIMGMSLMVIGLRRRINF